MSRYTEEVSTNLAVLDCVGQFDEILSERGLNF